MCVRNQLYVENVESLVFRFQQWSHNHAFNIFTLISLPVFAVKIKFLSNCLEFQSMLMLQIPCTTLICLCIFCTFFRFIKVVNGTGL